MFPVSSIHVLCVCFADMLFVFLLFSVLRTSDSYTFTMALMAPFTGSRRLGRTEVQAAINVTMEKVFKSQSFSGKSDTPIRHSDLCCLSREGAAVAPWCKRLSGERSV